jgi:hypothetical protein
MAGETRCIALRELRDDDARIAEFFLPRVRAYALLQSLGLPLLDGCVVLADDDSSLRQATALMSQYGTSAIVRSDPLRRGSPSIRGGDLWQLTDLRQAADKYLPLGRALLLLEPYERTANEWSFAALAGLPDRTFVLEVVGPGFDTGQLNRGRITPHEFYGGEFVGSVARVTNHSLFDRARYAQDLADAQIDRDPASARPLPRNIVDIVLRYVARVQRDTSAIFVLSGAVLQPGERLVFWDLYDPSQQDR